MTPFSFEWQWNIEYVIFFSDCCTSR